MARARFQEGSLGVRGKGPSAVYFAVYRVYDEENPKGRQKKETIGSVSKMSKREAMRRKSEIVAERTQQLPAAPKGDLGAVTFSRFYRERFLPMKAHWSEPHREGFTYVMETFVLPKFGEMALDSIDKVQVQTRLNSMSAKYSQSTIKHVRTKMVEVFEEAIDQEFINRNPAARTNIPSDARSPERPVLSPQQLIQVIDGVKDLRDKALFLAGTFCALRTSEVFGMPWGNFHHNPTTGEAYFNVNQIAWRGKRYLRTKTEASEAPVHISSRTLAAILEWRTVCKNVSDAALMFPSTNRNGRARKGAPMTASTWLQKRLQPIAKTVGITFKLNFRVTRRTASTLAQEIGASLASAQGMLRHASPTTTAKVYTRTIPENVKIAVNSYEDFVYGSRSKSLKRVK